MNKTIINHSDPVLVTGANGFIGSRVVEALLRHGFANIRCFVRPTGNLARLQQIIESSGRGAAIEILKGNLLSPEDCRSAARGISVIFHLAAGIEKSFSGSFMNSVVTTRNLLDAAVAEKNLKRFLNVSSMSVYSNMNLGRGALLDETCELETHLTERYEAYAYSKAKQDELLKEYGTRYGIPYVIVRPGSVYGPGLNAITARVLLDTFGFFLHIAGENIVPLTYVDNCAEAIVLAGITEGIEGEVFNIVDDDLPRSRTFLKMIRKNAKPVKAIPVPYRLFYAMSYFWERYSGWSRGQLPPVLNRRKCAAYWKGNRYSNQKLKNMTGWTPSVPFDEASKRYFEYLARQAADGTK